MQQRGEHASAIEVQPVICGVLGYQDQLPGTGGDKLLRLLHDILHRHRTVGAADIGNRAVGAAAVAALRNLQVGIAPAARGIAGHHGAGPDSEIAQHLAEVSRTEPRVDFGDFGRQFRGIALGEAAEDRHAAGFATLLQLHGLKYGLDRLSTVFLEQPRVTTLSLRLIVCLFFLFLHEVQRRVLHYL